MQDGVRVNGLNAADVPTQMGLYRLQMGLGRVSYEECRDDFTEQVCAKHPAQCSGNEQSAMAKIVAAGKTTRPKLMNRVAYWAGTAFRQGKIQLVTRDQAEQRASICANCPKNRKWETCHVCGDLIRETKRLLSLMRQGNNVSREGLLACDACGHENNTAVWMNNLLHRSGSVPENCWVGK